ncbi:MAG TPA: hypothetical protein VGO09_01940 [Flavisolibacter sp.]|nr:hypothetical protein [Flavisolibacter sp.]
MNKLILIFPDTKQMADFVLQNSISGIEVNSKEQTVAGIFTEEEILVACEDHNACLKYDTRIA